MYARFAKWRDDGTLEAVFHALSEDADMENLGMGSTFRPEMTMILFMPLNCWKRTKSAGAMYWQIVLMVPGRSGNISQSMGPVV